MTFQEKLPVWLGMAAVVVGLIALIKGYLDGEGLEAAGLIAVAVGLLVVSGSLRSRTRRGR